MVRKCRMTGPPRGRLSHASCLPGRKTGHLPADPARQARTEARALIVIDASTVRLQSRAGTQGITMADATRHWGANSRLCRRGCRRAEFARRYQTIRIRDQRLRGSRLYRGGLACTGNCPPRFGSRQWLAGGTALRRENFSALDLRRDLAHRRSNRSNGRRSVTTRTTIRRPTSRGAGAHTGLAGSAGDRSGPAAYTEFMFVII